MSPVTRALRLSIEEGVAVITFDLPGEPVNKFSRAVKDELAATMTTLWNDAAVRAIVLISGKPDTFIAGADIEEFVAAKTEDEFRKLSREGQQFLDTLEASQKPIVVAIHDGQDAWRVARSSRSPMSAFSNTTSVPMPVCRSARSALAVSVSTIADSKPRAASARA